MSDNKYPQPEIEPFKVSRLKVSDIHELYIEESGNPDGIPVLKFHGGPGSSSKPKYRQVLDQKKFRIVQYDQRGCGQSTPMGELRENNTQNLVDDIEKIRKHLDIDKWMVWGPSWGSTLGLAYSQKYPDSVRAIVLQGVFTFRQEELDWTNKMGANMIYPDIWEKYVSIIPEEEKKDVEGFYQKKILEEDGDLQSLIKHFGFWEVNISALHPDEEKLVMDEYIDESEIAGTKIFLHYEKNKGFMEDGELLRRENIDKIRHIPGVIIQGRYDIVCPMKTAWDLHILWPEAAFEVVTEAGHAMMTDRGLLEKTIEWFEELTSDI